MSNISVQNRFDVLSYLSDGGGDPEGSTPLDLGDPTSGRALVTLEEGSSGSHANINETESEPLCHRNVCKSSSLVRGAPRDLEIPTSGRTLVTLGGSPPINYLMKNVSELDSDLVVNMFQVSECQRDGHCLVHAVIKSLELQKSQFLYYDYLLYKIHNEVNFNTSKYIDFFNSRSALNMQIQLCAYIDAFNYNTELGDLLPLILTNILHMSIGIVEKTEESYRLIHVIYEGNDLASTLFIFKNNEHYDALRLLVPRKI